MVGQEKHERRADENISSQDAGPNAPEAGDPHPGDRTTRPEPHIPPPGIDPAQSEMPTEAPMESAGRFGVGPEEKGFPVGFWVGGIAMVLAGILLIYVLL